MPFKTIAALLSPKSDIKSTIDRAIFLKDKLAARLILVYSDNKEVLLQILSENGADAQLVAITDGAVEEVLEVCGKERVDLLISSALPREGLLKYYKGSISRQLVHKADCSLLLLKSSRQLTPDFKRLIADSTEHPKTQKTILTTIALAECVDAEEVLIAGYGENETDLRIPDANRIDSFSESVKVPVNFRNLQGRRGYALADLTMKEDADVLVLNSPDTEIGFAARVFTPELEYLLAELPANLLLVHSTNRE